MNEAGLYMFFKVKSDERSMNIYFQMLYGALPLKLGYFKSIN